MVAHELIDAPSQFDTAETERVFGDEFALQPPDPSLALAPVRRVALFAEAFLPKVDGVSKSAFLTLRWLQLTGREVIVFAPDNAPSHIGASQVIALPSFGIPVAPESRVAIPHPTIMHHLEEFQPDLIHMFSPALLSVSGMLYGRQHNLPVIANYQTDLPGYAEAYGWNFLSQITRDWLRFIHNGCHYTLAPSDFTIRQLQGWGYHRVRRWARGVDSTRFTPARRSEAARAKLLNGRDADSLLCLYVGRLANEKHVDLLLETARLPGVALTIVGDGPLRAELETRFEGTGTRFTGYLYGDELADAYASADAFMFTGTQETFGQVVQEALASGLPSVIVNQGGITDLVTHGVTGFVCPEDALAFADAARQLRDDPALRERMAENARRTVESNSWEAIMAQLEGHYTAAVRLNERVTRMYPPPTGFLPTLLNRGR